MSMCYNQVSFCGVSRFVPSGVGPGRADRPAPPQPAAARGHPDPPPVGRGGSFRWQQRGAQRPQLLPSGDSIFTIKGALARSARFSSLIIPLVPAKNKKSHLIAAGEYRTRKGALIYIHTRILRTKSQTSVTHVTVGCIAATNTLVYAAFHQNENAGSTSVLYTLHHINIAL